MRLPFDHLSPWQRWAALGTLAALIAGAVWLGLQANASRPLTAAETARFATWVQLTGDPSVTRAYTKARSEGPITAAEARAIMEIAKAHPPPYGLASDGQP